MITETTSVNTLLEMAKEALRETVTVPDAQIDAVIRNELREAAASMPGNPYDTERNEAIDGINAKKIALSKSKMCAEEFTVRDLFRGIEWRRIPHGKRIQLGSRFYKEVQEGKIAGITPTSKTLQNQQLYTKI